MVMLGQADEARAERGAPLQPPQMAAVQGLRSRRRHSFLIDDLRVGARTAGTRTHRVVGTGNGGGPPR
jgi:hypothetical protein